MNLITRQVKKSNASKFVRFICKFDTIFFLSHSRNCFHFLICISTYYKINALTFLTVLTKSTNYILAVSRNYS